MTGASGGKKGLIVAVDGPSGAGKSTITRLLAKQIGYLNIDTGAMYRTLALAVKRAGVPLDDDEAIARVCRDVAISFERNNGGYRVIANGEDVSAAIRTPEISLLTSKLSARRIVRNILTGLQRDMGICGGVILEGRDIGTVVFPDADVKFFLTASPEERGRRRFLELEGKGEDVSLERTLAEVVERDAQDAGRECAPLVRAADAVDIDSTGKSIEEVLALMEEIINDRLTMKSERGTDV